MRCPWCSNPESQESYPEVMTHDSRCVKCGKCEQTCPTKAITLGREERTINRARCDRCLECVKVCPMEAITVVGEYKTVEEIVKEAERDSAFYKNSGGGVTIGGGEPLFQGKFVYELLRALKQSGLSTALETCGYGSWTTMERLLNYTDLFLFDIKHMALQPHEEATGKSNQLILDNARRLAAKGAKLWLRVPLIPGFNCSEENIEELARFGLQTKAERISLLPYHEWGRAKYSSLGRTYAFKPTESLNEENLSRIAGMIQQFGLRVSMNE